ncbi:1-acylglycerol-3-phosphate O-acyltransferase [Modicella reniformis]|uniref:1-acyl-sn-glycerol-3-phosphate acyltransferase n=1 Tax=Modicella reniformis TaxID=1440133 RepID=A0A9P6J9A0_9FUNG|nr:1-acylglycerol-3-phosphate O-acyltransferase [Modicella reniformis]
MSIADIDAINSVWSLPAKLALAVLFCLALPRLLAALPQKLQFAARYLVFLTTGLFMSVVGCFIAIVFAVAGKRHLANATAARIFSRLVASPSGIKINVKGEEKLGNTPAIYVCNHQSNVDVVIIGRIYPTHCAIMAKKELKYVPFLGLFMQLSNVIFIDRKNHKKALESTAHAVAEMKKQNSGMLIFPEGTRSHLEKPGLLPFKKGAFHLAIQSQYPIIPIAIEGYSHVYSSRKKAFPGGEIEVRILDPIPTTGLTSDDLGSLMERTQAVMLENLKAMDKSSSHETATASLDGGKLPAELEEKGAIALGETEDEYHEGFKKRRTTFRA